LKIIAQQYILIVKRRNVHHVYEITDIMHTVATVLSALCEELSKTFLSSLFFRFFENDVIM